MCDTTLAQVLVRVIPSMCLALSDCLFSPFSHLVLFRVFLLSLLLLLEPGLVLFPFPCGLHRGKIPLALRQLRSLALWSITYPHRIRFMTAITPAYAHAYQVTCPARHMLAAPRLNFRLP